MNSIFHIIFGSIATIFFLIAFLYQRRIYQLLFALSTAYTFLVYLSESQQYRMILGAGGFILGIASMVTLIIARKSTAQHKNADMDHAALEGAES